MRYQQILENIMFHNGGVGMYELPMFDSIFMKHRTLGDLEYGTYEPAIFDKDLLSKDNVLGEVNCSAGMTKFEDVPAGKKFSLYRKFYPK